MFIYILQVTLFVNFMHHVVLFDLVLLLIFGNVEVVKEAARGQRIKLYHSIDFMKY